MSEKKKFLAKFNISVVASLKADNNTTAERMVEVLKSEVSHDINKNQPGNVKVTAESGHITELIEIPQ